MVSSMIHCAKHPSGYAELVIDRPQARNALCVALTDAMAQTLERLREDSETRVVLLRAEGDHFAAGADIREMLDMSAETARATDFAGCCVALGDFPKPVIGLVQGYALGGGCELVEMCDIVLAAENAVFGHPEISLGTMPGAGGTQRLPRLIGTAKAMDMLLSGHRMDAIEAERCGLVSRIVPPDRLLEEGREYASGLAALSGTVLNSIKKAVRASMEMPLKEGLKLERALFHQTLGLPDRQEGMRAFTERRKPLFNATR